MLVGGHEIFGCFYGNNWTRGPKIAADAVDAAVGRFSSISRCMAQSTPKRLIAPIFFFFFLFTFFLMLSSISSYLEADLNPLQSTAASTWNIVSINRKNGSQYSTFSYWQRRGGKKPIESGMRSAIHFGRLMRDADSVDVVVDCVFSHSVANNHRPIQ